MHFPLKSILGENFILRLSSAGTSLNKELSDALSGSQDAEMQNGAWVYLDMKNVLKNLLDTAKSAAHLNYRKNILDTANMVLTAVESITDVSVIMTTKEDISEPLQALLRSKPLALIPN